MIISKTPFRISFFGGGTDFSEWFLKEKGAVLSTSIDKYCYLSLRRLPPFFYHKHRIVYSEIELVENSYQIKHPSVRECFKYLNITDGLELHHDGDLPSRSGLGSSSSFTVGLIHALKAYQGQIIDKKRLCDLAIHIERGVLQEQGGLQDQVAVAFGGFNRINFGSNGYEVIPLIIPQMTKFQLSQSLCLFFTGKSRLAEVIEKEKISGLKSKTVELKTLYSLVEEATNVLTASKFNAQLFGTLLNENWKLKKSLAREVTNSEIDEIYAEGLAAGAYGGKLLGAGGGGFLLFCIDSYRREAFIKAMDKHLHVPFSFESGGSRIVLYDP